MRRSGGMKRVALQKNFEARRAGENIDIDFRENSRENIAQR